MLVKLGQYANAPSLILLILSGISTFVNSEHPAKPKKSIFVTGLPSYVSGTIISSIVILCNSTLYVSFFNNLNTSSFVYIYILHYLFYNCSYISPHKLHTSLLYHTF